MWRGEQNNDDYMYGRWAIANSLDRDANEYLYIDTLEAMSNAIAKIHEKTS